MHVKLMMMFAGVPFGNDAAIDGILDVVASSFSVVRPPPVVRFSDMLARKRSKPASTLLFCVRLLSPTSM
jgi:hypothetical protein